MRNLTGRTIYLLFKNHMRQKQYNKASKIIATSETERIEFRTLKECWDFFGIYPSRVLEIINFMSSINGYKITRIYLDIVQKPSYMNIGQRIVARRKELWIELKSWPEKMKTRKYDFTSDWYGNTQMFVIEDWIRKPYEIEKVPFSQSIRKAYNR